MVLTEELEKLGLSSSESKAYIALTSMKEGRASEIARVSKIPRNKIYAVLESLHMKGFVEIFPEKVMRFRAVPFDSAFLLFLESTERRVDELKKIGEKVANQLKHVRYDRQEVGEFTVYKSKKIIYKKLAELLQSAHESIALCLEMPEMRRVRFLFRDSGKKLNVGIITKIETGTRSEAKEWMGFADLKHIENMPPAKIAVIDGKEVFVFQPDGPIALHSTDKSFVSLIQNFTNILWNSSLPAEERIAWLETGKPIEEMKLIHGRENFYRMLHDIYRSTKKDVIVITTANGIIRIQKYLKETLHDVSSRGARIRCMSMINKSNLGAAEDLTQIGVEIRHIEKPKAVLSCHDNSCLLLIQIEDDSTTLDSPEDTAVLTNQRSATTTFRFILEKMWEQAKSLEERVHEIETGKPVEEVKFIRDEKPIYEITKELSSKAEKEICNLSTEWSPERAIKFGTLDTDMDRARDGVKLRYIYPITKSNMEFVKHIMEFAEVRHIESSPIRRVRIIDNKFCLLRQVEEELLNEKFCIFSQAKDFVSAMKMFYEKMWASAMPAEERIKQLEGEEAEIEEAKRIISQYREKSVEEPFF